jgi:hypothetical protein
MGIRKRKAGVDAPGVPDEAHDAGREHKHGRPAERVCPERGRPLAAGQEGHGVAEPTARAKGEPQGIERAEAEEMVAPRVHDGEGQEPADPDDRLQGRAPQEATADAAHPVEPRRHGHGCISGGRLVG